MTPTFRLSELMPQVLEPRNLLLVAANLLPVAGVLLVGWDTFLLIMLYWLETAVIGFWTVVGLLRAPKRSFAEFESQGQKIGPIGLSLFVMVHAGIFMGVHFMFVWGIFGSGIGGTNWAARTGGTVWGFIEVLVIGTGIWVPLAVLFVTRGIGVLSLPRDSLEPRTVLSGLYVRIIVMHLTIIFGAMLSLLIHSVVGLVLLVVLKTFADLFTGPLISMMGVEMFAPKKTEAERFDSYRRKDRIDP